jgi:hypothetical protein
MGAFQRMLKLLFMKEREKSSLFCGAFLFFFLFFYEVIKKLLSTFEQVI